MKKRQVGGKKEVEKTCQEMFKMMVSSGHRELFKTTYI
jgi:hypothetical protein